MKLTNQQEKFAQDVASGKSQAEAYRIAYPKSQKWKDESVWAKASHLMGNAKVQARVSELRAEHAKANKVTVETLLAELEEARQAALQAETVQASAATAATMGKAKLLGLDKQVIDLTSSDGSMSPRGLNDFYADVGTAKPKS